MSNRISIITALFVFLGISSCLTIYYAWVKRKPNLVLRQIFWLQFLILIWAVGDLLRFFLADYQQKLLIFRIEYGAICFIGFSWLVFCLSYVGSSWLTKRRCLYLSIWPLLCYLALLTNDWHHWFLRCTDQNFNQFGLFYYCHALGSYVYSVVGAGVLFSYAFQQFKDQRRQTFLLVLAGLIPLVISVLIVTNAICINNFDFTLFSFYISTLILLIGIIKYRLLDICPIALRKIVDQMKEIVVVIDNANRIIAYNHTAVVAFPELARVKPGGPLEVFWEFLQKQYQISNLTKNDLINFDFPPAGEIYLKQTGQWYCRNIQTICSENRVLGRVITLNDITEYKRLAEELHCKNNELTLLNRQLQEQAAVAEELAAVKERNRVVQDIHDTLGQTMTLLVTALQLAKIKCRGNPREAEVKLDQALEFAKKAHRQIRQALYGLAPPYDSDMTITALLSGLINEFATFGMQVQLCCTGDGYPLNQRAMKIVYHLCREAMTNTLQHGKSKQMTIAFGFTAAQLKIEIRDSGLGCVDFKAGIGLNGMEQRVKSLNGRIKFFSQPNAGFAILIELPKSQLLLEKD